ncbi:MAG: glycosyltransferase [Gemmatimonadetes bacterium]|nr:glycosyltransferase family 4 protein [Gemmatimonadota bacterium]NIR78779.1 glycosyltransferase family 4 protein [Gemmatimonadota bacterium]NIT87416.1 glycosyltransferase family 4 protein [Gemmatimonadota bacterium]NIU31268.1 glycosyltransferase family 4 protein [Gemmatimonadota bacterium]NIU35978.1 glycosyltransferase [Gemmatimonadota bacterium]
MLRDTGYRGPLAVIPQFGIDPERFRPDEGARTRTRKKLGLGCDDFVVGFAGRLVPEKGVEALLDAASATEGTTVVFIGEGPLREALESRARSGKDGVRARFVGRVPSPAIPRWLNGLDALVLPSRDAPRWSEQFGRVLVEAMACGVPVVGTDSGEIPRVIGDAGVVVAGAGARALAGALRSLRDDPGRRRALGEAGRRRALERFTNDRIARKTAAFYAELLTERQPSWAS